MGCGQFGLDGIGFSSPKLLAEKRIVIDHTLCSFKIWGLNRGLPRGSFGVFLSLTYGFPSVRLGVLRHGLGVTVGHFDGVE